MLTKQHQEMLEEVSNKLNDCAAELQELAKHYQEGFDELSEKRQQSEPGQELESLASSLQEAADLAQQVVDTLVGI
jgi:hypothetical protein